MTSGPTDIWDLERRLDALEDREREDTRVRDQAVRDLVRHLGTLEDRMTALEAQDE